MSMRGQRGFTLLELLVALGIGALVMPVVVVSIFQMTRGTARINRDLVIQQDLDNASAYFTRDLSQAQTTDLPADGLPYASMRVDWVDETGWGAESGDPEHYAIYSLSGSAFQREYDGVVSIVARNVESVLFSRTGDFVTVSISSTYGGATENLSYYISPRSDNPLEYVVP